MYFVQFCEVGTHLTTQCSCILVGTNSLGRALHSSPYHIHLNYVHSEWYHRAIRAGLDRHMQALGRNFFFIGLSLISQEIPGKSIKEKNNNRLIEMITVIVLLVCLDFILYASILIAYILY